MLEVRLWLVVAVLVVDVGGETVVSGSSVDS